MHTSGGAAPASSSNAPHVAGLLANDAVSVLHNFNGVSSVDSANVNGFDVEPPDQGLCVGNGYVVEPVNLALTIYHRNGTVIAGPWISRDFFGEPPAFIGSDVNIQGDVRCYFDPTTNTFFATQLFLTTALSPNVSHFDVAVNSSGNPTTPWTIYRFDTTDLTDPGCPCFGDQPLFGIDQDNIYISTNEFSIFEFPLQRHADLCYLEVAVGRAGEFGQLCAFRQPGHRGYDCRLRRAGHHR